MKKFIITVALMLVLVISFVYSATNYLLPFPIAASNGMPIRHGTFAVYDSAGSSQIASLTYLKGFYYYYTEPLSPNFYDVKQKIGSTWYTHLNNIWISNEYEFLNDSIMFYVSVDDSSLEKINNYLRVKAGGILSSHISANAIDSSHINDGGVIGADIKNGTITTSDIQANSVTKTLIATPSAGVVTWATIDSGYVTSLGLVNSNLALSTLDSSRVKDKGISGKNLSTTVADSLVTGAAGITTYNGKLELELGTGSGLSIDAGGLRIPTGGVTTAKIENNTILLEDLNSTFLIDSTRIKNSSVHNDDLAGSIANVKLVNSEISFVPTAPVAVNGYVDQSASISLGGVVTFSLQNVDSITYIDSTVDTLIFWYGEKKFKLAGE